MKELGLIRVVLLVILVFAILSGMWFLVGVAFFGSVTLYIVDRLFEYELEEKRLKYSKGGDIKK